MSIFKKALKKVVKPAARSFARGATSTFRQTVGRGARSTPNARQLKRVVGRINPVGGILKTTKALKPKRNQRRGNR